MYTNIYIGSLAIVEGIAGDIIEVGDTRETRVGRKNDFIGSVDVGSTVVDKWNSRNTQGAVAGIVGKHIERDGSAAGGLSEIGPGFEQHGKYGNTKSLKYQKRVAIYIGVLNGKCIYANKSCIRQVSDFVNIGTSVAQLDRADKNIAVLGAWTHLENSQTEPRNGIADFGTGRSGQIFESGYLS